MAVKVLIPQPLQGMTKGMSEVEVSAGLVSSIIKELEAKFPGIAERITEEGKLRKFINIYVDEEDIRFLNGEVTFAKDGSVVSIVPALAGGEESESEGSSFKVGDHVILKDFEKDPFFEEIWSPTVRKESGKKAHISKFCGNLTVLVSPENYPASILWPIKYVEKTK